MVHEIGGTLDSREEVVAVLAKRRMPVLLIEAPSDTFEAWLALLDKMTGLAVEVTLDGVAIVLQGVRILRRADGLSYVEMPCYRHTDGDMMPAGALPDELEDAIARAVLERARVRVVIS